MTLPRADRLTEEALLRALGALEAAAATVGVEGAPARIEGIGRRVRSSLLELAIVGEFKRGKSSLINALIGDDVLPVDVLPLTTVPTILERGERGCKVCFADGRVEEHATDELAEFVTEAGNPGNERGVDHVTVRLTSRLLDQGVRLVDTPGVGSVFEHNTRSATAYLPNIDVAILVTSADPPISEGEIRFLDDVLDHAVRLFVVLNKADYLDRDQLARTIAFTDEVVRKRLPNWPGPAFALSARPEVGEPERLEAFAGELGRFLARERSATVLESAWRSVSREIVACRSSLELERAAAAMSLDDLRQRIASFDTIAARLGDEAAQDGALLASSVSRALRDFDEFVALRLPGLKTLVDQVTVETAGGHATLSPGRLLDLLQAERPGLLRSAATKTIEEARTRVVNSFERAVQPVVERARARMSVLHDAAAQEFGLALGGFEPPEIELGLGRVTFDYQRIPPSGEALAIASWRLLGSVRARKRALGKARRQAGEELGMLFGRLRGEVVGQLTETARALAGELHRYHDEVATALTNAIERGALLIATGESEQHERTDALHAQSSLSTSSRHRSARWTRDDHHLSRETRANRAEPRG
ncbi:MAG: dynamin family protein [Actinomycetota bacterium]